MKISLEELGAQLPRRAGDSNNSEMTPSPFLIPEPLVPTPCQVYLPSQK